VPLNKSRQKRRAAKRQQQIPQQIPDPQMPVGLELITFSFKHLDIEHKKFPLTACNADFYQELLRTIKSYSGWSVERFCEQNHQFHRHLIDFESTTEPQGFELDEQLDSGEYWQICLKPTEKWRVHGFIVGSTFFIKWLDPEHLLCQPTGKKQPK